MSTEQNKALVRKLVEEVFNKGNISLVDEIMSPDFIEHEDVPGMSNDRGGSKQMISMLRSAFPDFKATIEDIVAEGDKVVIHMTWSGTQNGAFMGMPPSGKRMSIDIIDIMRVANGKFVEHWGVSDMMGMMQQLGAIPAPGVG